MKLLVFNLVFLGLVSLNANLAQQCKQPLSKFVDQESVINQFVFSKGGQGWRNICLEVNSSDANKACNSELDQWNSWIACTNSDFTKSCNAWAEKENFAANDKQKEEFVSMCVRNKYRSNFDLAAANRPQFEGCKIESKFTDLKEGTSKDDICNEVAREITGSFVLPEGSSLLIYINQQERNSLRLNYISLEDNGKIIFIGAGDVEWEPNSIELELD
ncbi:MAG: hypothetical protein AB8E15_07935 [Bdellovibrionales bacterium]